MAASILKIALDVPLDRLFDYLSADSPNETENVQIGQRVLVSFANRNQIGIVMGIEKTSEVPLEKLKPVARVFTDEMPLSEELIALIKFSAEYYQYPLQC
ncbi:MAG: hypothetical protein VW395_07030 [Methylotenera sp.]